ncbi:hypothetical protein XENTR_v10004488 [Xenopus tropicalis]|nr:hypothetical protein XENTR_v10004488 [Xenopus tropicalis]
MNQEQQQQDLGVYIYSVYAECIFLLSDGVLGSNNHAANPMYNRREENGQTVPANGLSLCRQLRRFYWARLGRG